MASDRSKRQITMELPSLKILQWFHAVCVPNPKLLRVADRSPDIPTFLVSSLSSGGLNHTRTPVVAVFPLELAKEWVTRWQEESERSGDFFPLPPWPTSHLWHYLYPSKAAAPPEGPSPHFQASLSSSNTISASCPVRPRVVMASYYYSGWPYHPLFVLLTLPVVLQIVVD